MILFSLVLFSILAAVSACGFSANIDIAVEITTAKPPLTQTFTLPLLDGQCKAVTKPFLTNGQSIPSTAMAAGFHSRGFVDSTGNPVSDFDDIMVKSQLTQYFGGPFGSDESFFNKIVCNMTVRGGSVFSFGGPFPERVEFGEQAWVDSYICGLNILDGKDGISS